jgi:tetratricopeptide (TPR) repeat protein
LLDREDELRDRDDELELRERELLAARGWLRAAVARVPAYAPALGHLAEVDAALGALDAAIARLRPLTATSDDPEYAATLAEVLRAAGRTTEAERWRGTAAAGYGELVRRHPEAFGHHAKAFGFAEGFAEVVA